MKLNIKESIQKPLYGKDLQKYGSILDAFSHNGRTILYDEEKPKGAYIRIKDLMTTPDFARFFPRVIHTILREALEPRLVITNNLFQKINLEKGIAITIGAIGAMEAKVIPEGRPYPIANLSVDDAGNMIQPVNVDKHGLLLPVTDEVIEEDQWDVMNIWVRAAGRALARHKEKLAMQLVNESGYTLFDNSDFANSTYGSLTGRNIAGTQNGTMSFNDLTKMFAWLAMRGFTPNTLIMHPLAWMVFATDPLMREIVLKNGTIASEVIPQGTYSTGWGTENNGLGYRTTATGTGPGNGPDEVFGKYGASMFTQKLNPLGATFYTNPDFLPVPLKVLVTPFAPYHESVGLAGTAASGKDATNVIMADSNAVGVLVQKSPPTVAEFDDPSRDIKNMKIAERYGFAILEQGKAIAVAKNVILDKNYVFENTNSVTLAPPSGTKLV